MTMTIEGEIQAYRKDWKRILIVEKGSSVEISFRGRWITNPKWASPRVDFLGDPTMIAGPNYRGPGYPEGCMLMRFDNEPPMFSTDAVWRHKFINRTEVFLAPNDGVDASSSKDNRDEITFELRYLRS